MEVALAGFGEQIQLGPRRLCAGKSELPMSDALPQEVGDTSPGTQWPHGSQEAAEQEGWTSGGQQRGQAQKDGSVGSPFWCDRCFPSPCAPHVGSAPFPKPHGGAGRAALCHSCSGSRWGCCVCGRRLGAPGLSFPSCSLALAGGSSQVREAQARALSCIPTGLREKRELGDPLRPQQNFLPGNGWSRWPLTSKADEPHGITGPFRSPVGILSGAPRMVFHQCSAFPQGALAKPQAS